MGMRGALAGCVVLVCLMAVTEGHITFFSPKEMMLMKEREGRKGMEPRSEDGQFEEAPTTHLPEALNGGNPDKSIEIAVRLSAKRLDDLAPVLEEIIHEIAEESETAK